MIAGQIYGRSEGLSASAEGPGRTTEQLVAADLHGYGLARWLRDAGCFWWSPVPSTFWRVHLVATSGGARGRPTTSPLGFPVCWWSIGQPVQGYQEAWSAVAGRSSLMVMSAMGSAASSGVTFTRVG